jgi:hypothetical protein
MQPRQGAFPRSGGRMWSYRTTFLLSCVILFLASAADVQAQSWKKHRYAADGFEVEFSGSVLVKPNDLSAEARKTLVRSTNYIQGDANTAYILSATLYVNAPDLDVVAKRGFGVLNCKTTLSDNPLSISGGSGREFRGAACNEGVQAETRYFLIGKWLYQALALYKTDGGDEKAARYFVQSFKTVAPAAAQSDAPTARSDAPTIRTLWGLRYEIPAGWEWTEFDGYGVTIQHLATKTGEKGKEASPNKFSVSSRKTPDDAFERGWDRLDRNQQRTLPGGATVRWKAGPRWRGAHYVFEGEAKIGAKILTVSLLDRTTPRMDVNLVEAAFLRVAETLRDVPESAAIYHPGLRIAVDRLKTESWYFKSASPYVAFACWTNAKGCGEKSNTWVFAYPSSGVFADAGKALADITGHFEKSASLKIGEVRRAEISGGEVLWTEQPGSMHPFLAAVRRDGRYFFIRAYAGTSMARTHDALREDFLAVAKNVRAWDGK